MLYNKFFILNRDFEFKYNFLNNDKKISEFFENDLFFFLPEIFLCFIINLFILFYIFIEKKYKININNITNVLSVIVLIFTTLILFCYEFKNFYFFDFHFQNNVLIFFFKSIVLLSSIFWIISLNNYFKFQKFYNFEILVISLLSIFSTLCLISSNNFISLYLTIELQSLCLYILSGYKRESSFSTEAALKYFILGAFSSGFLLLGCSIIYGITGILNFTDLGHFFYLNNFEYLKIIILGCIFILISFFFKLGIAPFHFWIPEVYEGIDIIFTFFFSIFPKIGILSILFTFLNILNNFYLNFYYIFNFVIICSLIFGSVGAIFQTKIKKFFAYSAITNIGFIFMGFLIPNFFEIENILFFIFVYVLNSIGFFYILLSLKKYNNNIYLYSIYDLKNISTNSSLFSIFFAIILFSMAGIPPLMGFFAKFFILKSLINYNFFFITFIGIFVSIISSFYYVRIIKIIFFDNKKETNLFFKPFSFSINFIICLIIILNCVFFLIPNILLDFIHYITLEYIF